MEQGKASVEHQHWTCGGVKAQVTVMFLEYYKLNNQPFGVTPDPDFLFLSPTHREALACLSYGVTAGTRIHGTDRTTRNGKNDAAIQAVKET